MFVGREAELRFLQDKYEEKGGQLVVLYGRRRIGKTETLREFCKDKPHVFFSCTQCPDRMQLANFSKAILQEGTAFGRYIDKFQDWTSAFCAVSELPCENTKKLLVIDEFPYMCTGNPGIPSMLQNVWDEKLRSENVMIILCGSALSFVEKELLAEKNPLYGRATGIYKMRQMGFYDAVQFFPEYSAYDKILTYAILGGVPHYLQQWNPELDVAENICRNILRKGTVLYSETDFLLHQELRETRVYNAIISAVAMGSSRLNEISQKALIDDTGKTSAYLKTLLELGIVEREFPVSTGVKQQGNSARGLYRLADSFFRFWYAFGFANISLLEDGDVDGVFKYSVQPFLHSFASLSFEDVCRQFVKRLQRERLLPSRFADIGRWWGKATVRDRSSPHGLRKAETEVDILGVSPDGNDLLVGECKFKSHPFGYGEFLDLAAKRIPAKEGTRLHYALFSQSGFDRELVQAASERDIRLYNLNDIVDYTVESINQEQFGHHDLKEESNDI